MLLIPYGCALAFVALFASNAARPTVEFTKDTFEIVQENIAEEKAVLVDVRSVEEWKKGHIEGSILLPVTSLGKYPDAKKLAKILPKKKVLYTFCVVGMRAKQAAKKLEPLGYEVRVLKPGYDELIEAGFKKGENKKEPAESAARNEDSR
jgi:rhodanese-related sulfurtransferase